jgi:hypothetical protein
MTTWREFEYQGYIVRIERRSNIFTAQIFRDLTEPAMGYLESEPSAESMAPLIALAKLYINDLTEQR